MRILVAGAGAVGSWLGGSLALGGAQVQLLGRGRHAEALRREGLWLRRPGNGGQRARVTAALALSSAEAASAGPYDAVLICVKAYAVDDLLSSLLEDEAIGDAALVCFSNGVGSMAEIAARLPKQRLVAATLTQACWLEEPGLATAAARGGIGLASPAELGDEPWLDALTEAFEAGDLALRRYEDAAAMRWSKLLLNMLGSATSAILGWPPARVFRRRDLFQLELLAFRETLAVMRSAELRPLALPGYPVPRYASLVRRLPDGLLHPLLGTRLAAARGDRLPGPAADLAAGRPRTEIDYLAGAVAREASRRDVAAPINATLAAVASDLAAGRRPQEDFRDRPEALLAACGLSG